MSIAELKKIYPNIAQYTDRDINVAIFNDLSLYLNDPEILAAALIQEPHKQTEITPDLEKNFDTAVAKAIFILNKFHDLDEEPIEKPFFFKPFIILFLLNYKHIIKSQTNRDSADTTSSYKEFITHEKLEYAVKVLEKLDVSEIRSELEDVFFSLLEPKIYNHYYELLKFTQKNHQEHEQEVREKIDEVLAFTGVEFEINSRLKSIYSIHKKITKKKILYSQVLDTVGLRILVDTEKDCYQVMGVILKNWPILNNKIKDYIALPKRNGYKSIHLTIIESGYPVEIQIRTKKMHHFAQYGLAAHHKYKLSD